MLMGGYQGVEGEVGTSAMDDVELLILDNESMFKNQSSWCQKNLSSSPLSIDGATIDMINTFDYVEDHKNDPTFTSPHYSFMFERALVCGGADSQYHIKRQCRF